MESQDKKWWCLTIIWHLNYIFIIIIINVMQFTSVPSLASLFQAGNSE